LTELIVHVAVVSLGEHPRTFENRQLYDRGYYSGPLAVQSRRGVTFGHA